MGYPLKLLHIVRIFVLRGRGLQAAFSFMEVFFFKAGQGIEIYFKAMLDLATPLDRLKAVLFGLRSVILAA